MDILFHILNSISKKPLANNLLDLALGLTENFSTPPDEPSPFSSCPSLYPTEELSLVQISAVVLQWLFLLLALYKPFMQKDTWLHSSRVRWILGIYYIVIWRIVPHSYDVSGMKSTLSITATTVVGCKLLCQ